MNENSIKSCTSVVLIPWGASGRDSSGSMQCTRLVTVSHSSQG
jgi:hypothetical protein